MKIYLISDTHFNHAQIATYCDRPADFTERIIWNWRRIVKPEDCVIHLGDVFIGKSEGWKNIYPQLTGRKILIRGNHDNHSLPWWMSNGFDAAVDAMQFRNVWLTHKPSLTLPEGTQLNIHGHLHNCWDVSLPYDDTLSRRVFGQKRLPMTFNRLFAIEYTNYMPIEFDKFVYQPQRYRSITPE